VVSKVLKKCYFLLIFAKKDALLVTFGEFSVLFGTFLPLFLAQKCNSPIITPLSVVKMNPFSKFSVKNLKKQLFSDFFTLLSPTFSSWNWCANFGKLSMEKLPASP